MTERERLKKLLIDYPCMSTAEENFIEMVDRSAIKCNSGKLHFCPNCGAKMKGATDANH